MKIDLKWFDGLPPAKRKAILLAAVTVTKWSGWITDPRGGSAVAELRKAFLEAGAHIEEYC